MINLKQKIKDWNKINSLIKIAKTERKYLNPKINELCEIYSILYSEKYNQKNKPQEETGEWIG